MSKLGSKTGGSPCYFLSTRSQKINEYYKNWAKKIEDVFVYIFGFLFYGISHTYLCIEMILGGKKYGRAGLIFVKMEIL